MSSNQCRDSAVLYEGTEFTHRIEKTILRGRTVFSDGEFLGNPGFGRFVTPSKQM
jgi:dihydroorotase-like cyclic amidohydrolase